MTLASGCLLVWSGVWGFEPVSWWSALQGWLLGWLFWGLTVVDVSFFSANVLYGAMVKQADPGLEEIVV